MSRVGKYPIKVPQGVTCELLAAGIIVSGKLGRLSFQLPDMVIVNIDSDHITVQPKSDSSDARMQWGTVRAVIANMTQGVTNGYTITLEINGTGYRAAVQGSTLVLNLGFSHEINYQIPEGISISTPKPTVIVVSGIDKTLVGQVASEIRAFRMPEPYKGKGIKYEGEQILRKEGKKK